MKKRRDFSVKHILMVCNFYRFMTIFVSQRYMGKVDEIWKMFKVLL